MLSSVNILYYMLFVYSNLGELHVGDRQKKKSGPAGQSGRTMVVEREKKTKKRVGVGMLGQLDVVKRGRKVKFMG